MRKIATPVELADSLRGLLAYAQTYQPSRVRLARELHALSVRVAADDYTAFASYPQRGKIEHKNCSSVAQAQKWLDEEHPDAHAYVRHKETSDGTTHQQGGKNMGKMVAQRDGKRWHRE